MLLLLLMHHVSSTGVLKMRCFHLIATKISRMIALARDGGRVHYALFGWDDRGGGLSWTQVFGKYE